MPCPACRPYAALSDCRPAAPALVNMLEEEQAPVPYAYMRTLILSIRATPALKALVADELVPRLVKKQVRISHHVV